jgi:hypothetical protein
MTAQLREAIARLRVASSRQRLIGSVDADDLVLVCDALEDKLCCEALMAEAAPKFDKNAYQREYMRKRRKRAKMIRDSSRWLPPA